MASPSRARAGLAERSDVADRGPWSRSISALLRVPSVAPRRRAEPRWTDEVARRPATPRRRFKPDRGEPARPRRPLGGSGEGVQRRFEEGDFGKLATKGRGTFPPGSSIPLSTRPVWPWASSGVSSLRGATDRKESPSPSHRVGSGSRRSAKSTSRSRNPLLTRRSASRIGGRRETRASTSWGSVRIQLSSKETCSDDEDGFGGG